MPLLDDGLLPWDEIALRLHMPVDSVKRKYATAIAKLRNEMIDEGFSQQEFAQYVKLRFEEN